MKTPCVHSPIRKWAAAFALIVSLVVKLRGAPTIDFVQFTDPHLFEKTNNFSEEIDNLAAFAACINEANKLHRQKSNEIGKGFDFVIVTGDLGIEELTNNPSARTNALTVVSEVMKYSLITNWYFVPGNNDIKVENPTNIGSYHRFIEDLRTTLAGSICVSNLCPPGTAYTNSVSAEFQIGRGHFIGFDNACFKSDKSPINATNFNPVQLASIQQVASKVSALTNGFAYIFYHIPEVDDPLAVTKPNEKFSKDLVAAQKAIGNTTYTNSGWVVLANVRKDWNTVVDDDYVKGLITGHFHSNDRAKYLSLDWTKSAGYHAVLLNKLSICPPIACKRQVDSEPQARGFRIYSIDATNGNLLTSRIIWYEAFHNYSTPGGGLKGCSAKAGVDNQWDSKFIVGLATALIAIATLAARILFDMRTAGQNYYSHFSKIWYDLKCEQIGHSDWADEEQTSLRYLNYQQDAPPPPDAYDIHAWASWALAEDWYLTFARSRDPSEPNISCPERTIRCFRKWFSKDHLLRAPSELLQFGGPVRSIFELHWAWLRVPENHCRFDTNFHNWLAREFVVKRYKVIDQGVIQGKGIQACENLEPGDYIGHFDGPLVVEAGSHTLQIGERKHVKVETDMMYLNHSSTPNAFVRGLNVVALSAIQQGNEITIDYNATEWELQAGFTSVPDGKLIGGFSKLGEDERRQMRNRLHLWIREKTRNNDSPVD